MAVLLGCETPRIFTPPLRELTPETSWGFDIIWFAREILREPLTPWQEWFVIHAFELMPVEMVKAMYPQQKEAWSLDVPRFKTVLLLIARQNGKTHVAKVVIKWALFRKRMRRVLGAAQTKNDAKELWEEILEECEGNPKLRKRMRRPSLNNGSEALKTPWGAYKIAGLDRKAARGKTNNFLFMDEMREHTKWDGFSALSSTTLSPVGAMNMLASNAGDFRSVVLKSIRDKAIAAIESGATETSTVFIAEWSADPERDIDDREGWRQANPDLGHGRMTERDILAEREAKTDDEFRTENLCQWVDDLLRDEFVPAVSPEQLAGVMTSVAPTLSHSVIAVDATPERTHCSIALGGMSREGNVYGMVGYHGPLTVTDVVRVIDEVCNSDAAPLAILIDPKSPAEVLIDPLEKLGWYVVPMKWADVKSSTAAMLQGIDDKTYSLASSQVIRDGFACADLREDREGGVAWSRQSGVISQIVALSFAMWGVSRHAPLPKTGDIPAALPVAVEASGIEADFHF